MAEPIVKTAEIIRLENIDKRFKNVHALKDVTFTLAPGETLGLVGGNGAGKSTLMNVVGGVLQPDDGKIFFENAEVSFDNPRHSQNLGIHFIHQELALFATLTVAENIFISELPGRKITKLIRKNDLRKKAKDLIDRIEVPIHPDAKIMHLPMGQRQIVEILRAVSSKAKVIIFDEPTSSLSISEKEKLFVIIENLKKSGVSIIYISHIFDEVFEICERVSVMRDGRHVGSRKIEETTKDEIVKLMLGESIDHYFPKREPVTGNTIVECKDVSRKPLIKNINMHIRAGEIVGLWGLLGSGRTEIARAIYGLDKIDSGQIFIGSSEERTRKREGIDSDVMGFIPEDRKEEGLFLTLSVRENITAASFKRITNRSGFFIDKKLERSVCDELVKKLNIVISGLDQNAQTLSGGNQQKQIVARWLNVNPSLVIFDEPTRGLDIKAKADIHFLLDQITKEGQGILLISSEIEEIIGMCDRVYVIRGGTIVGEYKGSGITKNNLIQASS